MSNNRCLNFKQESESTGISTENYEYSVVVPKNRA